MIVTEYANEGHIVKEFIQYTLNKPVSISPDQTIRFFVWGFELWLPEGGKQGYSGSIDLIASDELGNVWLIEAKQSANPELNPELWRNQILNYRWALARRSHNEISMKSRRFLLGNGSIDLIPNELGFSNSLFDAFKKWSLKLHKDIEFAKKIYNRTIQAIKEEKVISTVMADVYIDGVWNNRPRDKRPYAYIVTKGIGADFKTHVILDTGDNVYLLI